MFFLNCITVSRDAIILPLPQVYAKSVGVSERHQRFAEGRSVERQLHQQQRNDDHVTGAPVGEGTRLNIWS